MGGSLNRAEIIGHLGRDPEIRTQTSGDKIATLSVATSESWTDKQSGDKREKTEWHRVVIFNGKLSEIAEKYLRKGSRVFLDGQLQTRKWTDKDGAERYTTEIVLTAFRGTLVLLGDAKGGGSTGGRAAPSPSSGSSGTPFDDSVPF